MPSVGAVTSNLNVKTPPGDYTAVANDLVLATGGFTVTMPTSPVINTVVAIKKIDASTSPVSIVPGGTANLNGDTSALLAVAGAAATFQYDGTNWQLISTGTINTSAGASASLTDAIVAPVYTVGLWYDRRNGMPAHGPIAGGGILNGSTIYYVPFYAHTAIKIDQLGVVTGATAPASGSGVRIGVYRAAANRSPGTFVVDLGLFTLPATTNTWTTSSVFTATTIPQGWNYFALSFNSFSPGNPYGARYDYVATPAQGLPASTMTSAFLSNASFAPGVTYYTGTGDAGASALTTSIPTATPQYVNGAGQTSGNTLWAPNVWYRIAA